MEKLVDGCETAGLGAEAGQGRTAERSIQSIAISCPASRERLFKRNNSVRRWTGMLFNRSVRFCVRSALDSHRIFAGLQLSGATEAEKCGRYDRLRTRPEMNFERSILWSSFPRKREPRAC